MWSQVRICVATSNVHFSPVNGALLFADDGFEIGELQEAVVEVMQVQDADQQEGRGDEDAGEQIREDVLLQTDVPQSERQTENHHFHFSRIYLLCISN